jgi:hypothetical protein
LQSLPRTFYDHPLTWLVDPEHDFALKLSENITPNVRVELYELLRKFEVDWAAVRQVLVRDSFLPFFLTNMT